MKYSLKSRSKVKKKGLSFNTRCCLCLVPSLLGMLLFYIIPYLRVWYCSLIDDQFHKNFVGFRNYIEIAGNQYFQLAMKNSLLLILIGVPIVTLFAILLSLILVFLFQKRSRLRDAFIFPMLVPTAGIVLIWQKLFASISTALPIYLLFLWKNVGICIILLTAAITTLDGSIFEAARIDGAKPIYLHTRITIPLLTPTIFFVVLLSIVNSFKIFKESYLYYGNKYPPDHSYTLQFYMNNNFQKFDYQALAASSVMSSLVVLLIVIAGLKLQRRFQS